MELPQYIEQIGIREFAARFRVTERAALSYMKRARLPRQNVAERIVKGSPVTWEGIYAPSRKDKGR